MDKQSKLVKIMKNKNKTMPLYSGRLQANYRIPETRTAASATGLITFIGGNLHGAFVVKAPDDTMRDAGIAKGAALLIKPNMKPTNGALIWVNVNGRQLLRYFVRRGDKLSLRAANNNVAEIVISAQHRIIIEGVMDPSFS